MVVSRPSRGRAYRCRFACISLLVGMGGLSCRPSDSGLITKEQLRAKRLAGQNQHLQEFAACPSCFVSKIQGGDRMFLFDAVVDCNTTVRLGSWGDGGKWLCDPDRLPPATIVYSFGVGNEISFDEEMAAVFGAEVYMFDPTPSVSRQWESYKAGKSRGRGHIFFHALGLGPVSDEAGRQRTLTLEGQPCPAKSLSEIAGILGHTHVDILKIDIEGGEFAAFQEMGPAGSLIALRVKQILVEFHLRSDRDFWDFVRIVRGLADQGYLLFRKELNPAEATHCAEFAFVHVADP